MYYLIFTLEPYLNFLYADDSSIEHNMFFAYIALFFISSAIIFRLFIKFNYLYFKPTNQQNSLLGIIKKLDKLTNTFVLIISCFF